MTPATSCQRVSERNPEQAAGFTLTELVITIILTGILAASILPRFVGRTGFDALGFRDESLSILRYGHKLAIAQRRTVYANLNNATGTVELCYTNNFPCNTAADQVPKPSGEKPYRVTAPSNVALGTSVTFFIDAVGRPYNTGDTIPTSTLTSVLTASITGDGSTYTIMVEPETGFVHK